MVVSVFYNCINCFTSYIQKCLRHTEKVLDKIIRDEFLKKMNQETKFKDPQNALSSLLLKCSITDSFSFQEYSSSCQVEEPTQGDSTVSHCT